MTVVELSALLADPSHAGAYFVDARDRAALLEAARALEMTVHCIDLQGIRDKPAALRRIAEVLSFPDGFGQNWDALADSLNDLSWLADGDRLLLCEHANQWREADPEQFATFVDIAQEAAERWAEDDVALWTLLPLPSVELEVMDDGDTPPAHSPTGDGQ